MIDPAIVDRIAELARLGLTDAERRLLAGQLGAIVAYVDQLQAIDLGDDDGVDPLPGGPGADRLALRPDVPGPSLPRDAALAGASDVVDGHLRVPPVLGDAS